MDKSWLLNRSWIHESRLSWKYETGVEYFIEYVIQNANNDMNGNFFCPCVNCCNGSRLELNVIREHLLCDGFLKNYTRWIWHGENIDIPTVSIETPTQTFTQEIDMDDQLEEMIRDVGPKSFKRAHMYESLCSDSEKPLYPNCTKFTRLSAILRLFNLKARNRWSDKSFTELLELLKEMLPEGNTLPSRNYEAKKVLCPMGLEYKKIHGCPNDCMLYHGEYEGLHQCPKCGLSRYKKKQDDSDYDVSTKGPPAKVLWYLPIVPRLKRLFANADNAKLMRWHEDERKCDGQLRHPADCLQWKKIDSMFPHFSKEPRNFRLGLATDGMNPFGNLSTKHSSWPVLLPGNDIDVYLTPLVKDLKMLWEKGIDVYNGYSVKGHKACPICEEDTCYHQLVNWKKTVYLGHRRFLQPNHPYRRLKKTFNGCQEYGIAPTALTGEQVYDRVKNLNVVLGKSKKQPKEKNIWKKRSIFFYLPYWKVLDVRHRIDVMHVEKNVCDSVIGTLLNLKGKTKDGLKSRLDLQLMGIREQLYPQPMGKRTYLSPACHTLSKKEKTSFCESLRGVKVPYGYSSNVKSLVSMKDLKLVGLKSYDCHVLMQQFLPIAIRDVLPKNVSKVINPQKLDDLENEAVLILCQLEMYFPPSFFDIMVHLIIHLVREVRLCGPVFLRWMYPVERYMKILKGYVKNQHRPEASIIERYIAEEAIEFCTEYMSQAESIGIPKTRHEGRTAGKGTIGIKLKSMMREEVLQAHLYILNNTDEVLPYLNAHKDLVKTNNPRMPEKWVLNEHNKTFIEWFKVNVGTDLSVSETLQRLAQGPNFDVFTFCGYDINNYSFYTKAQDDKSTMQNSRVMIVAQSMHFSTKNDNNLITASMWYFGVIEDIWEVDYGPFRVPIFKCKWVDSNSGVKIDELGFTLVDLNKVGHKEEPFIMAFQVKQVFYVTDPSNKRSSIVLQGRSNNVNEEFGDLSNIIDTPSLSTCVLTFNEDDVDDVYATREDHREEIWENNET
ncbi:uncharacterized protein LOC113871494 [Abrus precatorius]|uniref:Uncharacterized protein LOC113871494 n=1 Tax=Abrus precatorius TaxID=3816 RepID=A0A8B8M6U3_ABRPR|nr:uncharacterized protein LOC113871494 [Abrus precatorius]